MNTATYTCDPGYQLVGAMTRTCQDNGEWSHTKTNCEREYTNSVYFLTNNFLPLVIALSSREITYDNNTKLEPSDIGEGVFALGCHTELTTCCRDQDNPNGEALGDWVGPDGNSLPETRDDGFYMTREMSSVSFNLPANATVPGGLYCCTIPRAGGVTEIFCVDVQSKLAMSAFTQRKYPYISSLAPATESASINERIFALGVSQAISIAFIVVLTIIIVRIKQQKTKQAR